MKILNDDSTLVALDELRPHPRNPRKGNVPAIEESISANGWYGVVVVQKSTGYILAGNHRVQAAQRLGAHEVPVQYVDVDDATAIRILLADNRTNDLAKYSEDILSELLEDLRRSDGGLEGATYDEDDANQILSSLLADIETHEDQAGDPEDVGQEAPARTKEGDLWILGEHRVLCGDSTDPKCWVKLWGASREQAKWMWTDPPYGVDYKGVDHENRGDAPGGIVHNDGAATLPGLLKVAFSNVDRALHPRAPIYVACPPGENYVEFFLAFVARGWKYHQTLTWVKDHFVLGHSDYHMRHESVIYGWKGKNRWWYGGRDKDSVLEFQKPGRNKIHPTMKPIDLVAGCLANSSMPGDLGVDPFLGSGTTLITAEQLSRRCYGIEYSPTYVDRIVARWEELTGLKAKLQTRGDT